MGRQSSYLTSFGRTHCLRLPPATADAWDWQLRGSCLGHPLEVFFPDDQPARPSSGAKKRRSEFADSVPFVARVPRSCAQDSRAPRDLGSDDRRGTGTSVGDAGPAPRSLPVAALTDPTRRRSISSGVAMATDGTGSAGTRRRPRGRRCGSVCSVASSSPRSRRTSGPGCKPLGRSGFSLKVSASPTVIALVQTASLTPTLLLALFAGALADRVDRRRLLIAVQAYAAVATAVLAVLAVAGVLDAVSLLVLLFAVGCAAALTTPAWQAIQPELVPREQLRYRGIARRRRCGYRACGRPSHRRVVGGCVRRRGGVRNQCRVLCCSHRRAAGLEADTLSAGSRA